MGSQYTQGIPYFAFAPTVTAPPAAPLLAGAVEDGAGVAPPLVFEDDAEDEDKPAGTAVEVVPSKISTCPAGNDASGLAVVPK